MGEDFLNIAREYQEKIEDELKEICKETIDLVEGVLLPRLLGGTEHYEQQHQALNSFYQTNYSYNDPRAQNYMFLTSL